MLQKRGDFSMPNKKTIDQAMIWLKSIASDKNSLDGINAQTCLNVISHLQNQLNIKGAIICEMRKRLRKENKINDVLSK